MYLILTYHINLDGEVEAYNFLESHAVMSSTTSQDLTTYVTRRLNPFFYFFIQTSILLFLKLLMPINISIPLDALQKF